MGDRGNIAVIQSQGDQVWLYSHGHAMSNFDEIVNEIERTNCDPGTSEITLSKIVLDSLSYGQKANLIVRFKHVRNGWQLCQLSAFFIREHA